MKLLVDFKFNTLQHFGVITFLLFVVSCKYDRESELYPGEACENSPLYCPNSVIPEPGEFGYYPTYESPYIRYVSVNPLNSNELFYYQEGDSEGNPGRLYRLSLETNQKQLLYSGQLLFKPAVGKNGWILLNPSDSKIWKIRFSGEDLSVLLGDHKNFGPNWNYEGTEFTFNHQLENYESIGNPIYDSSFASLDTITGVSYTNMSWINNKWLNARGDASISVFNYDSGELQQINVGQSNDIVTFVNACWSQDGQQAFLVSSKAGLYEYDFSSQILKHLRCNCKNDYYFNLGTWGNDFLVAVRERWTSLGGSNINISSTIVRLRKDGTEEIEIIIPD